MSMDKANVNIRFLCDRLTQEGTTFSYDEIKEILHIFKDVTLKLIVTNIPREVYSAQCAKESFEQLFRSFDPQSTFLYLPSFNRAQVFMTTPEAALCARLQTQGWKLPDSVLAQLSPDSRRSFDHTGINCYIDQMDEEGSNDDSEQDSGSDEKAECTCESSVRIKRQRVPISVVGSTTTTTTTTTDQHDEISGLPTSSDNMIGQAISPLERKFGSLDHENTSEASGDDAVALFPASFSCPKHGARKVKGNKMKHLLPPKPSRLFLLSPPTSPPVGWAPKPESEPVINYELLEALAGLAPGEPFELHPPNPERTHPSITITPCEPEPVRPRPQILQTRCPERKS